MKIADRLDIVFTPRPDLEAKVNVQSVSDFHLRGVLSEPQIKDRLLAFSRDPDVNFHFVTKIGADGAGQFEVYHGQDDLGSSLFATTFASVALVASKGLESAMVWKSPRVNASSSHTYLRLKYEREIKETSRREMRRLFEELTI